MNIALYFGSFNPIHKGHTQLARYILDNGYAEEVWLIVSPNNPLKDASTLTDEHWRKEMAQIATRDMPDVKVSDIEFGMPKPNYTINTLRSLSSRYPEHRFMLVIGSDNMAVFNRWREYESILRDYRVIVYPREGDDIISLQRLYPQMEVIYGAPLMRISATEIRKALSAGSHACDDWIDEEVRKFFLRFCLHISDKNSTFAIETE